MTRVDQVTVFTLDFAFIFVKLSEVKPSMNDYDFDFQLSGLSLRAGGRGFSPATKRVAPGYFHWKIEEK